MKKKVLLITFSFICFILLSAASFIFYQVNFARYKISSPMEDLEYKKSIIKDSKNIFYNLENLRPLVGETELINLIKENNNNPQIYTPSLNNRKAGIYRINLHIHTKDSDGARTVKERMDEAQLYAQTHIKDGYLYIALTDHNTVLGAQNIIKVLQENPNEYKNIKIIAGMEISTLYKTQYSKNPIAIHVLTLCINPYDEYLNEAYYKKDLSDKWNMSVANHDFEEVINEVSEHALVGIAHPARYIGHMQENVYPYLSELFDKYLKNNKKLPFTEGYYQSYRQKEKDEIKGGFEKFANYINNEASKRNIFLTGSTDSHSITIFRR